MEKNVLLTISYDGTPFHGWQRQPDAVTVQGEIERVLSVLCAMPVQVNGTSRTDAGVHALAQRASFCGDFAIPVENLQRAMNDMLPGSIRIVRAEEKPAGFHARFDCRGKKYIYQIVNSRVRSPFRRNYCYYVERELDIEKMRLAAGFIEGRHDFKCFQAAGGEEKETTVRTISGISLEEVALAEGRGIRIHVSGDGFLYNMVRIISGTLVDVGLGKIEPQQMKDIIESGDRTRAGHTAPARGLYLAEVYY
ncbi:MAG: tRNA pseudouridine(38-40) synthase TruA [Anaerovoracaceae bacterium]|jgi:tRNA pseudouridine38-40 synthase